MSAKILALGKLSAKGFLTQFFNMLENKKTVWGIPNFIFKKRRKTMSFKPLGQRVLVQRVEEDQKTASGIIIPDNAKEKPLTGKVEAVSKEVAEEGEINAGDTVVFAKYGGTEIKLDGKEYLVMNLDDVLGVLS
jgi:chaperonin GroES